ncbi:MAG TPA: ATP-binding protein, partial [Chitinophagaceae bacterium]|nr:ATP-binding protein [Chitinophagaceae bacterium]
KEDYIKILNETSNYLPQAIEQFPDTNFHGYFFSDGAVWTFSLQRHSKEDIQVMKRFASVFSLTFRRYKDLQKAEAQAREAQIEVSLERVRASAMAMHNSVDLSNTIREFYQQTALLSETPRRCGIDIIDKDTHSVEISSMNTTEKGASLEAIGNMLLKGHRILEGIYDNWLSQKEYYPVLEGKEIREYYDFVRPHVGYPDYIQDAVHYGNFFPFPEGCIYVWTTKELSEDELKIYRRFTSVLSLTYKRYKDLRQAEAQAKESQIEAALERVRSRAMAMQNSEELGALIGTVFAELTRLDLRLTRCVIWIVDSKALDCTWWMANSEDPTNPIACYLPYHEHEPFLAFVEQWKKKAIKFQYELRGVVKKNWDDFLFSKTGLSRLPRAVIEGMKAPDQVLLSASFNNFGALNLASLEPLSDEHFDILLRFAKVFDLTYTRFNDLKQAEAQAKEAMIEAALERVRGKAMAMHNSKDLSVAASMVFTELRKIGINSIRCGVGLLSKETRKAQLYSATSSPAGGDSLSLIGWIELSNHPVSDKIYESWLKNEDYFPELRGEQLKSYYDNLLSGLSLPSVPNWQNGQQQYGSFLPFSVGCLYAWSESPYNDTEIKILKRFAAIIDLTFRRYMELQTSEANARAAVKQAALDRIRADIASMRTIGDLDRITPLIWNELTILGIPFIRCGVFIMDDSQRLIHTFLSTPDGKAIAAFHIPYDTPGNITQVLSHWGEKKNYIDHWDENAFTEFAGIMARQGGLVSPEQYLNTIPKGGFYLHFLPFLQGMLYVGNSTQLAEEEIKLIQSVADAFSTAYARYEDFNKLEAAKQQVDNTLAELKQAQTQLVQSEKMASLGELTAGIAHEIQNPLNFVNNFSEVSNELLDEMMEEVTKGNYEEIRQIVNDVKQNLEKINHHGKRADSIVKGMLQHSRVSSGQKELTDINVLTDEYLRLAYHGLRAKDKSFNAKFETEFDDTIGKINIVPQDMGRVVLNLISNAFYAAPLSPKAGFRDSNYSHDPTVWISTKKEGNKILISVKDNGPGIPSNILDKIFQPFFTTKPTGQGTGLGLSLSYDIVKAHGGELMVKTKEGEGSLFIIQLPTA